MEGCKSVKILSLLKENVNLKKHVKNACIFLTVIPIKWTSISRVILAQYREY